MDRRSGPFFFFFFCPIISFIEEQESVLSENSLLTVISITSYLNSLFLDHFILFFPGLPRNIQ